MAFDGNTWLTYLLFSCIALVAFLGNALVLYVLLTRPFYLKHPYNVFIFSLAVADITTAIMLIFSRYLYLPATPGSGVPREIYCKAIWAAWILFTLGYISIYTCLALTVERWLAVVKPQVYQAITPPEAIKAVIVVWLWGIAINVTTLFRVKFSDQKRQCTWTALAVGNDEFPWMDFTLQSIIPFVSMVILYGHILYTMKKMPFVDGESKTLRKITKVALAASLAIIVGWLPSRVTFMLSKYAIVDANGQFHFWLVMLAFANSCVNPFLYGIYSSQFRKEYKEIFAWVFRFRAALHHRRESTSTDQTSAPSNGSTSTQL